MKKSRFSVSQIIGILKEADAGVAAKVRRNGVWSWDITKLKGPDKWKYFYLCVILDIFCHYVVGRMVVTKEIADLVKRPTDENPSSDS